ncbi:MAG TPA: M28 family peptidase, partial [Phycisphaerae bacterium]|nr:M28 family peptidase [Phycisphaerae bacterium]
DYIVEHFKAAGLAPAFGTDGIDKRYTQEFQVDKAGKLRMRSLTTPGSKRKKATDIPAEKSNAVQKVSGEDPTETTWTNCHNVAAILPGVGALAGEYIIVGAHYDHLGFKMVKKKKVIYYGADDNASGTAGLIVLAKRLADRFATSDGKASPRRSIIFSAFSAEEIGLLGSKYMCEHLAELGIKKAQIAAMINMDMIGRCGKEKVWVWGITSGDKWQAIISKANEKSAKKLVPFKIINDWIGPGDHASFYSINIPVLSFFTGPHSDFHQPTDKPERINSTGAIEVLRFVDIVVTRAISDADRIVFVPKKKQPKALGGYLGSLITTPPKGTKGALVKWIEPKSPVAKAGLQKGDIIVALDGKPVDSRSGLFKIVGLIMPGKTVKIKIIRTDETIELPIKIGKRK